MRRQNNGERAFTLIELAAVVAILGIAVTMFVMKVDNVMPRTRLRAAARLVGSTVELAASDAVMKGGERAVLYDQKLATITVRTGTDLFGEEEEQGTLIRKSLPPGVELLEVEGVHSEQDRALVVISPSGRMSPHAVHLRNSAGRMTVEIYGVTGKVRYHNEEVRLRQFTRETIDGG